MSRKYVSNNLSIINKITTSIIKVFVFLKDHLPFLSTEITQLIISLPNNLFTGNTVSLWRSIFK